MQNHDQVGNRAHGERLNHLIGLERLKVGVGLLLTAPFSPGKAPWRRPAESVRLGCHAALCLSGASAIYKVDLETMVATNLTPDSLLAGELDWSPDGTRIAFSNSFYSCATGRSDCRTDAFVMDADGTSTTRLTQGRRNNGTPSWPPEADRIVFTHSNSAQFQPQQIYVMNADGTDITGLTPARDSSFGPAWGSE